MSKKRVLIVDDEAAFSRLVKLTLEETGQYEVRTEVRGSRAVAVAMIFRPDLILLDIIMPDVEGSVVAEQIRNEASLSGTPIVFVTAIVSRHEVAARGSLIGGHPFLAKPVSADEILRIVDEQLAGRQDQEVQDG